MEQLRFGGRGRGHDLQPSNPRNCWPHYVATEDAAAATEFAGFCESHHYRNADQSRIGRLADFRDRDFIAAPNSRLSFACVAFLTSFYFSVTTVSTYS